MLDFFAKMPPSINCVVEPVEGKGGIYIGNYTSSYEPTLQQYNITSVISVVKTNPAIFLKDKPHIKQHLSIPAEDSSEYDISQHFDETFKFIESAKDSSNILIHCFSGISRSSAIALAYLMRKHGWSYLTAFSEVSRKRHLIDPNDGFVTHLKQLESKSY